MNSRLCQHHGQSILLDPGWSVETHVVHTPQQFRFSIKCQVKIIGKKRFKEGGEQKHTTACNTMGTLGHIKYFVDYVHYSEKTNTTRLQQPEQQRGFLQMLMF